MPLSRTTAIKPGHRSPHANTLIMRHPLLPAKALNPLQSRTELMGLARNMNNYLGPCLDRQPQCPGFSPTFASFPVSLFFFSRLPAIFLFLSHANLLSTAVILLHSRRKTSQHHSWVSLLHYVTASFCLLTLLLFVICSNSTAKDLPRVECTDM